jgi:peroxiredoxin Q/BCP
MVDPPKATKGRRMSKKTRKKSSKTSPGKAARAAAKTPVKSAAAKTRKAKSKKSGKSAGTQTKKTTSKASHKAPSKRLKSGPSPSASKAREQATGKAAAAAAPKAGLAEGAKAPAFRLPRDGGSTVSLSDYAGKKLVLFFYPRADTPGCTREAIDFTRLESAFAENDTFVLGVSADPPKAQESFRDKHRLSIPLVSDEKHGMLDAYGVWGEKSMYGRTFQGILRTTVLIGANGRIEKIWRNVRVDGHADEVLATVRAG